MCHTSEAVGFEELLRRLQTLSARRAMIIKNPGVLTRLSCAAQLGRSRRTAHEESAYVVPVRPEMQCMDEIRCV